MTAKLMAGDKVLLEQEYYSVGGGFIEWKGYAPPKKNPPKYPYATMAEVLAYTKRDNISLAQLAMANETGDFGPQTRRRSTPSSTRSSARCARR